MVAVLVRDIGDLDLAEDVAQEAFVEAARRWEHDGWPDRPAAWLLTTARRRAIDRARRDQRFADRVPALVARRLARSDEPSGHELVDDQLALLLGCCHPALAADAQVALTLRVVAGLSTAQIARAFFVSESTMGRRLSRAKTKIRGAGIPFTVGDRSTLIDRVAVVSGVIYSIFTEGHSSASAATLVRGDLCDEAVWLAGLLHSLVPDDPEVSGLLALLLFTDARRATRVDADGALVTLARQDRSRWDRSAIERGREALAAAHRRQQSGPYQIQAAIAAVHATAPSFAATDWAVIVKLYDVLLHHNPAPVVALNRAVAVGRLDGPRAGLDALAVHDLAELASYPYLHSTCAEFCLELGLRDEAAAAFAEAIRHCGNDAERRHLEGRRATALS